MLECKNNDIFYVIIIMLNLSCFKPLHGKELFLGN